MTDQLFLSLWLRPSARDARLSHFEKLLRLFPFSQRPQPQSTIAVLAIDLTIPPLFERPVNGPVDISEVMAAFRDFSGSDVAYQFESWWDLWQYRDGWKLEPARVCLSCIWFTILTSSYPWRGENWNRNQAKISRTGYSES